MAPPQCSSPEALNDEESPQAEPRPFLWTRKERYSDPTKHVEEEATEEAAAEAVQARHDGKILSMRSFSRDDAQITQGAIVSNKLLSGALQQIKDKQAKKDSEKLEKARTKRERRLLQQRAKAVA